MLRLSFLHRSKDTLGQLGIHPPRPMLGEGCALSGQVRLTLADVFLSLGDLLKTGHRRWPSVRSETVPSGLAP